MVWHEDGNRGFTAPPISPESTEYVSHPFNANISNPSAPLFSSCTLQLDSVYLDTFSSIHPGLVRTPEARPHTVPPWCWAGAQSPSSPMLAVLLCFRGLHPPPACLSFLFPWEQRTCHAGTYSSGAHFCLPCHMNFTHACLLHISLFRNPYPPAERSHVTLVQCRLSGAWLIVRAP